MTPTSVHLTVALRTISGMPIGPVYMAAELRRQVERDPDAWMGRMVRVQGLVVSYRTRIDPFTWITHPILIDTGMSSWTEGLPLALGPADPVRAYLRRLPVVGRVAPRAQTLHWDTLAIYRVQFRALHGNACTTCYEAVLLDAA